MREVRFLVDMAGCSFALENQCTDIGFGKDNLNYSTLNVCSKGKFSFSEGKPARKESISHE